MRRKLIESDLIECVLGLGPNLFYNSPMEACVVICRITKPKERRKKILLINAVAEVTRERAQSFLTDDHIERIVQTYRDFQGSDGFAHVATIEEIRGKEWSINIPLFVKPTASPNNVGTQEAKPSLAEALAAWQASSQELRKGMAELLKRMKAEL